MSWYEKAEAIRPPSNDDALLRWNACARLIMRDPHLVPTAKSRASRCCRSRYVPPYVSSLPTERRHGTP